MIKRTEKLVITFHTTTDAMAMEQVCKSIQTDGRLIPVPRHISAGCGLAWCARPDSAPALMDVMEMHGIAHQGVYRCLV